MSSSQSTSSGISGSTLILISRLKHMWPESPGPASSIFVVYDRYDAVLDAMWQHDLFRTSNLTTGLLQLCAYSLPATTLAPLQRVLNAAVWLVHDLWPREHVTPAMYELHWLPIAERIRFKLCLSVHHAVNGRAPSYLTELVTPVANIPRCASLRSARRHDLVVPRSRLVSSERAFSVAAPRAWNSLPVDIRMITDTKLFKKKLKTFLFNSAYWIRQWNFV